MKKRLSWLGALVLLLSLLPLQGKDAKVKVLTARLLSRADYLSSTLATLSKGEKVAVEKVDSKPLSCDLFMKLRPGTRWKVEFSGLKAINTIEPPSP